MKLETCGKDVSHLERISKQSTSSQAFPVNQTNTPSTGAAPEPGEDPMAFFAAEWTRAHPIVCSYVLAILRQPQEVDDVVQEVAVTACRDIERFDRSRSFLPWVLSIARFRAIDFQRKQGRSKLLFNTEVLEAIEVAALDLSDDESECSLALQHCIQSLQKLQPKSAEIIRHRYESGLAVQDIARKLGKSPNAISITLHRARTSLQQCVRRVLNQKQHRA